VKVIEIKKLLFLYNEQFSLAGGVRLALLERTTTHLLADSCMSILLPISWGMSISTAALSTKALLTR
jgi:hypothetical protein